ncbi:MAG: hypothetical protein EXQ56_08025 [Acidobacteria bacterium]|nr:hypothetical protein [Acidobacteriota bacterium]
MLTIKPKDKSSVSARVFLFLFGSPFVGGGLVAFYAMAKGLQKPEWTARQVVLPGIMGVLFLGVGLLLVWAALFGSKKVSEEDKRRANAPDQPWRWREDWAQGRVNSTTRSTQNGIWFFAIFWNLVSAPVWFFVPEEAEKNPLALIGLLFPLIGVGLLTWAVRITMRARRFGATWFEMSPLPAVPGSYVVGTIHARFSTPPSQGVMPRLSCLSRTFSGTGDDRNTNETILWREERNLPVNEVMLAGGEASIPVRFTLPADALVTTVTSEQEAGIFWSLTADASLAGIDYQDDFEIPVYKTGAAPIADATESGPVFASDRAPQSDPASFAAPREVSLAELAQSGTHVRPAAEGTEYCFAAARNISFAFGLTVFTVIWTGALAMQIVLKFPWFFRVITGVFELLLILIMIDLWLGTTTLTVGGGMVRTLRTVLGLGWRNAIPFENITKFDLHINMQTSGRRGTPYYALRATLLNGRHRTLVSGIRDKRQAEWLAAQMRSAIGLRSE